MPIQNYGQAPGIDTPTEKPFKSLQAQFALAGHQLTRTNPLDGVVTFHASRWGFTKPLASLAEAERFLKQIGGRS